MPRYSFDTALKVFTKQCSCCKELTVGTVDEVESLTIFKQNFGRSSGTAQAADDLQSRCRTCNSWKRRNLGVTLQWLREMHQYQEGCCAICAIPVSLDLGSANPANVDHNHKTNEVRQLLCGNCNRGIGLFFDNAELLRQAADYIDHHQENKDG